MPEPWQQLSESYPFSVNHADLARRQQQWLMDCVMRNKNCDYGKQYHFEQIKSVTEYQRKLPIVTYEDISVYINRIQKGEADSLFSGSALAFERTSGSSSEPKLIPYSSYSLQDFRRAILPWFCNLGRQYQLNSGLAYWAISPATRQMEITTAGIPVGLPDAAYLGEDLIPFFMQVSAIPYWVGEIPDVSDWQLATLYYLVCSRDLSVISVWSPSFLLTLIEALSCRRTELEALLKNGMKMYGHELPANPEIINILAEYYAHKIMKTLWPDLKVISCWGDASSKPFFELLKSRFPETELQAKGLLLTEGVVTMPDQNSHKLLCADSGFYEFIDQADDLKLAHQLEPGTNYRVVITTSGGLYRYQTNDWVACRGHVSDLPILEFIGRDSCSDMVGEKLTEAFATSCLEPIPGFRMLLPVLSKTPGYLLILEDQPDSESLVQSVETRLLANSQYAYARKMGQLKPLGALRLIKPLDIYLNSAQHNETRLGDIKVPSICVKTAIFKNYIGSAA